MKPTLFLAGALALAVVPGALLLSGCGGGGGGSNGAALPELRFARSANVEFPDAPGVSGILTVNFVDVPAGTNARAAGTLQLFDTPPNQPDARPFTDEGDGSADDFIVVVPGNATYLLVGDLKPSANPPADLALDLRGSYEGSPRFTVRGDFIAGATVTLEAPFRTGNSQLRGRLSNINRVVRPGATPTPVPTATPTITPGATTNGGTNGGATTIGNTNGAGTAGATTNGATTNASTAGNTTGATTGATTNGSTLGSTLGGNTTGATPGNTTGSTTNGATTNANTTGSTTGATQPGSTLGGANSGTTNPPQTT